MPNQPKPGSHQYAFRVSAEEDARLKEHLTVYNQTFFNQKPLTMAEFLRLLLLDVQPTGGTTEPAEEPVVVPPTLSFTVFRDWLAANRKTWGAPKWYPGLLELLNQIVTEVE